MERSQVTLLFNGSQTTWFLLIRSLRQGCPLSSYLFFILKLVQNFFSVPCMIICWKHIILEGDSWSLMFSSWNHLLLARAKVQEAIILKSISHVYCSLSRQPVSYFKSYFTFSPSTPLEVKNYICSLLNIASRSGVWKYLGVPILGKAYTIIDFNFVINQVTFKIPNWSWKTLSKSLIRVGRPYLWLEGQLYSILFCHLLHYTQCPVFLCL